MSTASTATADFSIEGTSIFPSGDWTLTGIEHAPRLTSAKVSTEVTIVDGSRLESLDTSGAAVLLAVLLRGKVALDSLKFEHCSEKTRKVLILAWERSRENARAAIPGAGRTFIEKLSDPLVCVWLGIVTHLAFLGEAVSAFVGAIRRPKLFRIADLTIQLERAGLRAIPIVSLVTFLIGLVVAYLFSNQAEKFGASIFVVDAIGMGMCRELSPVLTAIIIAGRSGSAFAAQIGSMKISDEIDAIRVMGLSPMHVLVLPRVLALVLALPFLVFIGDILGILGGFVIANAYLNIPTGTFFDRLQSVLALRHVWVGLGKAPLFAIIVALIGCRQGLTVEDNARSVGTHTTATVVQSIVAVIILDALLAVLFQELGW